MTRRAQIEAMLAQDPEDAFLRYGLALEMASAADFAGAWEVLRSLLADQPNYIPAYLQAGQLLVRLERFAEARGILEQGIAAARSGNDDHAAEEMAALLATLPIDR